MDILHKYLEFLWNSFQYDINVFSQGWLYYWLLIPAAGYFIFFIFKWIVLTAPAWLPTFIIFRVANLPSPRCESCLYKTAHEFEGTNENTEIKEIKTKQEESTPLYQ